MQRMLRLTQDVYKKLAQRLDTIPNGFPSTENGIELKLLAKLFTPEEASLAAIMRLSREKAENIANKVGMEPVKATIVLERMAERGLIRARGTGEKRGYALMPWVVGIYEEQLGRLDKETAQLFEQYYQGMAHGVLDQKPSLHKIVPLEKSIPVEIQVHPYEQVTEMLNNAKSFAKRKCICRVQKKLIGQPCQHTLENCLSFAPQEGAFDNDPEATVITREEALELLRQAGEEGLIHSTLNVREGHSYICNCCTCCCGIMRGIAELGLKNSVATSDFYAQVSEDLCTGCETCIDRCQFKALSMKDYVSHVDLDRCVGCGLCVATCPDGALKLVRKSEELITVTPKNIRKWTEKRAKNRGISLEDIL